MYISLFKRTPLINGMLAAFWRSVFEAFNKYFLLFCDENI